MYRRARSWALCRYSAERGDTSAALNQAQSIPMLSPQQVVFLEDAEAIEKFGEKNREETVSELQKYLDNPAPFTVLVIEAARLDERMKLAKVLSKTLVVEVGLGGDAQQRVATAAMMAGTLAKEQGLEFERRGGRFGRARGRGFDALENRNRKLRNYLGDRKQITREDVNAMVASEKMTTVWELADLLAARQARNQWNFWSGCCVTAKSRVNAGSDDLPLSQTDRGQRN